MKKLILISLVILLVGAFILAGCASSPGTPVPPSTSTSKPAPAPATSASTSAAPTTAAPASNTAKPQAGVITLTYADQNYEQAWGPVHTIQPYLKKLEDASGGRVKFQPYWGQTLVKGPDMWDAVKTDVADVGWCFHNYWPGMTELANAISLPGLDIESADEAGYIIWNLWQEFPSIQNEFKDNHVLTVYGDGYHCIITRTKQINTVDDIKGLKLRAAGENPTNFAKALGAIPMSFAMPDAYEALDKGTIDGMFAPFEAVYSFKLYETVKYMTDAPFSYYFFSISMNNNKWNSLPKDIQDAWTKLSDVNNARLMSKAWSDDPKDAMDKAMAGKVTETVMAPDQVQKLLAVSQPLRDDWVKKMNAAGKTDAQKVLDRIQALIKQYQSMNK